MAFDLVGIGGANLDLCHKSFFSHVMKDSNPGVFTSNAGGVIRNICENASKLGVSTALITAVGKDAAADVIIKSCQDSGVATDYFITKDCSSSMYVSLLDQNGDMAMACSDMRIAESITPEDILAHIDVIKAAKVICVDGNLSAETLKYIAGLAAELQKPVFFDPVSTAHAKKFKDIIGFFDTAKPNLIELATLSDSRTDTQQMIVLAAQKLLDKGMRKVFVTLGEKGAFCISKDAVVFREAVPVEMKNATGAGDAFMAALIYCELQEMSAEETLEFAMAAGKAAAVALDTVNPEISVALVRQYIKQ